MNELKIIVSYSEEDECYVAKLEDFYLAAHGDTQGAAMKEMAIVLNTLTAEEFEDMLQVCRKRQELAS